MESHFTITFPSRCIFYHKHDIVPYFIFFTRKLKHFTVISLATWSVIFIPMPFILRNVSEVLETRMLNEESVWERMKYNKSKKWKILIIPTTDIIPFSFSTNPLHLEPQGIIMKYNKLLFSFCTKNSIIFASKCSTNNWTQKYIKTGLILQRT